MTDHACCELCGAIAPVGEKLCQRCGLKVQLEKQTNLNRKLMEENVRLERQLAEARARLG